MGRDFCAQQLNEGNLKVFLQATAVLKRI